jgi:hypothetical protein
MNKFFSPVAKEDSRSFGGQITIFLSRYGMNLFKILLLDELGTCPQNLISTRSNLYLTNYGQKKVHK